MFLVSAISVIYFLFCVHSKIKQRKPCNTNMCWTDHQFVSSDDPAWCQRVHYLAVVHVGVFEVV